MVVADSLSSYLESEASIVDRLSKAEHAFFATLNYPPQLKEDVVLRWLFEAVTSCRKRKCENAEHGPKVKRLKKKKESKGAQIKEEGEKDECEDIQVSNSLDQNYSNENRTAIWKVLTKILCSKRLNAMCSKNWLCPIPSSFAKAVVDLLEDSSADVGSKSNFVLILNSFQGCPSLSAQVTIFSKHSESISISLLKLVNEHDLVDEPTLKILNYMISETYMHLKATNSFDKTANIVFGGILLPAYKLVLKLQQTKTEVAESILTKIREFIQYAFQRENVKKYEKFFKAAMIEYDTQGDISCQKFFSFLRQCIEYESVYVGSFVIKEILTIFRKSYADNALLCLILTQAVVQLIGLMELFPKSKLTDNVKIFNEDSLTISYVSLEPVKLDVNDQFQYLFFCLQSILTGDVSLINLQKSTMSWVRAVANLLLDEKKFSAESLQCIRLILRVNPELILNNKGFLEKLLLNEDFDHKYSAYDNLLCDVLSLYIKLRKFDELFDEIFRVLLKEEMNGHTFNVPELSMRYLRKNLFPPKFMKEFLSFISSGTVPLLLHMWKVISEAFLSMCDKWSSNGVSSWESNYLCLWLASECMGASPFLDFITLAQYDEDITETMNSMGKALAKLFEIAQENIEVSFLISGVLKLCLCWGELHARLISTDTCYCDKSIYNKIDLLENDDAFDFSHHIPFISSNSWIKLIDVMKNTSSLKKIVIQLLIQKLSIIRLNRFEPVDANNEVERNDLVFNGLSKYLEIIFSHSHDACENMELIIYNLPLLFKYMGSTDYRALASVIVNQLVAKNRLWEEFMNSILFAESSKLQVEIFLDICHNLFLIFSKGKKSKNEDISYLEFILKELNKKPGDFDGVVINQSLKGLVHRPKLKMDIFKKNMKEILNLISIINLFPVYCLKTDFLSSIFTFLIILLNEIGGFTSDENEIVACILKLLNRLCYNPNMIEVFSADEASVILHWLFKERGLLINSINEVNGNTLFEDNFKFIVSKDKKYGFKGTNIHELSLAMIKNVSRTFVKRNIETVLLFVKDCIMNKDVGNKDSLSECILVIFSAMGDDWMISVESNDVLNCLISVSKYCLELSAKEEMPLADIALCLVSFTALWSARGRNLSQHGLNNKDICITSLKYIDHIYDDNINCLMTLSLNFLKELASSAKFTHLTVSQFLKICSKISIKDPEFEIQSKCLNKILSSSVPKYLGPILEKNLKCLERSLDPNILAFWLVVVHSKMNSEKTGAIRCTAIESLISMITLKVSYINKLFEDDDARGRWILLVLEIFLAIAEEESANYSMPNMSLILTACTSMDYSLFHGQSFEKVFKSVTKILLKLQRNHFYMIQQRITVMISVVQIMISAIIDKSKQENILQSRDVQSLETVTISLEKVVESLKRFGPDVSKLGPFLIASIVNGIVKTPVHMAVKTRLERMVFLLMDYSDSYGIKHLLTALPASSIPLLRHLHNEFKDNYMYKQREH